MMMTVLPGLLILLFVLFFFASFWLVLKTRDDLFAVFYVFLFLYTIFTQIGYVFYPDIAIYARVYFGLDLFFSYWLFVFLSFVATVVVFLALNSMRKNHPIRQVPVGSYPRLPRWMFFLVTGLYVAALSVLFAQNYQQIRYANIENIWIAFMINSQPVVILVLYMKMRRWSRGFEKLIALILWLTALSLFVTISVRAGQRLLGFSLLVGVATFELSPFVTILRKHFIRLVMIAAVAGIFLFVASRIVALRNKYAGEVPLTALSEIILFEQDKTVFDPRRIIQSDLFSPSSLIFVSMKFNWIHPIEVLRSNVYNYVILTKYPYLMNILSEVANPYVNYSRSESYGYYVLTEGFNFAGWWGILYNALMINIGLSLWRFFASSQDKSFNVCMTSVLSVLVISIVRGPSVYFVRSIYLSIVPAMLLVSFALGYYPKRRIRHSGYHRRMTHKYHYNHELVPYSAEE